MLLQSKSSWTVAGHVVAHQTDSPANEAPFYVLDLGDRFDFHDLVISGYYGAGGSRLLLPIRHVS